MNYIKGQQRVILVSGQNCAWQLTYRFERVTPGTVNRVQEVYRSAAGKGVNVARVLNALELPVTLLAYLGGANGRRIRTALRREGINTRVVEMDADTRTCVTLLEMPAASPPARQVTELVEPAAVASGAAQERFAAACDELLRRATAVVIAGTAIGGAQREVYAEMVRRARRHGVVTLLDAYRDHGRAALRAAPAVLKINRAELAELARAPVRTGAERVAAYRHLRECHGVQWVMVTAGAEGLEAYDGTRVVRATPPAVPVVNSIGSGDAAAAGVIAGMVAAAGGAGTAPLRLENADLAVAARYAVACGSANCHSTVPGVVTRDVFRQLCAQVTVSEAAP